MTRTTGAYAAPNASRYLQQPCKHFGHKVEAVLDDTSATIAFPPTTASLAARPTILTVALDVEDPGQVTACGKSSTPTSSASPFAKSSGGLGWKDA